ncbi:uncharacterized protein ACNLHF_024781 [Anomaloglossus baeobatrachus]
MTTIEPPTARNEETAPTPEWAAVLSQSVDNLTTVSQTLVSALERLPASTSGAPLVAQSESDPAAPPSQQGRSHRRSRNRSFSSSSSSSPKPFTASRVVHSPSPTSHASAQISEVAPYSDQDPDSDSNLDSEHMSKLSSMMDSLIIAINETLEVKVVEPTPTSQSVPFNKTRKPPKVFENHKEFDDIFSKPWEHPDKRFQKCKQAQILYPFAPELLRVQGASFPSSQTMNNSNVFGGQQTTNPNTQNQNAAMFGQTTLFGQNATVQPAPAFGQPSTGQSAPMFGQLGNNQSVFGQNTLSQSSSIFGQTNSVQTTPAFGQASGGLSAPTFGQGSSSGTLFGQAPSGQSNSIFGQATARQSAPTFGHTANTSVFGLATSGQTAPLFGQSSSGQSAPSFGQSTNQSAPAFGQGTSAQFTPIFGQSTPSQSPPVFGQTTSALTAPAFGQVSSAPSAPAFGQVTTGQSGFTFGQTANNQASTTFAQQSLGQTGPAFGLATTGQSSSLFGHTTNTQTLPAFGQTSTGPPAPSFGQSSNNQSSIFGQITPSKSASPFAQVPSSQSTSLFAQATTNQSASFFTQPTTSQSASPFGSNTSIFSQATSESSAASRQSENGSNQGPQFGQQSPSNRFLFGQTPSNPTQTPMFAQNVTGQSFSQAGSTQSGPNSSSQVSAFGQVNSGQSNIFGQSPGFQPPFSKQESGSISAQPSSAFGIAQSAQVSKTAATEKMSIFGQSSNISTVQTGSVFGTTTQISTSSSAADSTFTQVASNSEHSFKPPAHTTFKPILPGANKSDETSASSFSMSSKNESKDPPLFGAPTTSSTSGNVNFFFSMSSEKKNKGEAGTPRPSFASANSSFTSFVEEPRREEGQKGVKRKPEYERSPRRNDVAISGEASSDPHSEHPPVKRAGRLNRDLKGGANIYVRSLFDVVKSQMKTHRGKEIKKSDNVTPQAKVTDADSPAKTQSIVRPTSAPNQTEPVKTSPASLSSQVTFNPFSPQPVFTLKTRPFFAILTSVTLTGYNSGTLKRILAILRLFFRDILYFMSVVNLGRYVLRLFVKISEIWRKF